MPLPVLPLSGANPVLPLPVLPISGANPVREQEAELCPVASGLLLFCLELELNWVLLLSVAEVPGDWTEASQQKPQLQPLRRASGVLSRALHLQPLAFAV